MESFYCIKCGHILSIEKAESLFRTGYYRTYYRLGCCTACQSAADNPAVSHAACKDFLNQGHGQSKLV